MKEKGDRVAGTVRRLGEEDGLVAVGFPRRVLVGERRELRVDDVDGVVDVGGPVHVPGVPGVDGDEVLVAPLVRRTGEVEDRHVVDVIVARAVGEVRGAGGRHGDIIIAGSQRAGQETVARARDTLGQQAQVAVGGVLVVVEVDVRAGRPARPADRSLRRGIVPDEPDPVDLDRLVSLIDRVEPQRVDQAAPGVRARVEPQRGDVDDVDEPVVVDVEDVRDGDPVIDRVLRPEELSGLPGGARAQVHPERQPRVLGGVDREVLPGLAQHRRIEVGRVEDGDVGVGVIGGASRSGDRLGRKDAVLEGDIRQIGRRQLDGVEDPPAEVRSLVHVPAVAQGFVRVVGAGPEGIPA